MKKATILNLITFFMVFSAIFSLNVYAVDIVKSPNLNCITEYVLEKGDSSGIKNINAMIYHVDNDINILVEDSDFEDEGELDVKDDEKVFVAAIDNRTKQPIKYQFLGQFVEYYNHKYFITSLNLPNYCDRIDLHFYKQKKIEPDFAVRSENFLGRTKVCMANVLDYKRAEETNLKILDKNSNIIEVDGKKGAFLSRLTPNYFSIKIPEIGESDDEEENKFYIGKIVLNKDQENLLSEDEKIVVENKFVKNKNIPAGVKWENSAYEDGSFFNFFLPKEIKEFKFLVYEKNVSNDVNDIICQFNIKLNRK